MEVSAFKVRREAGRDVARPAGGFTLLELMLVLALAAILASVAAFHFTESEEERVLRQASNELRRMALQAVRRADAHQEDHWIAFSGRQVRFGRGGSEAETLLEANPASSSELRQQSLPKGVTLQWRRPRDESWSRAEAFVWRFMPGGLCEPVETRFHHADSGAFVELKFNPLTGRVDEERFHFP